MSNTTLKVTEIITEGLQARAAINAELIATYSERMQAGDVFPPCVVFWDGTTHYLGDGHHRLAATLAAGRDVITCEVRPGTRDDALWYALGANGRHGLRPGKGDVAHAIRKALATFPDKNQSEIARQVGCSREYVNKVSREGVNSSHSAVIGQFTQADFDPPAGCYLVFHEDPEEAAAAGRAQLAIWIVPDEKSNCVFLTWIEDGPDGCDDGVYNCDPRPVKRSFIIPWLEGMVPRWPNLQLERVVFTYGERSPKWFCLDWVWIEGVPGVHHSAPWTFNKLVYGTQENWEAAQREYVRAQLAEGARLVRERSLQAETSENQEGEREREAT